MFAGRVKSVSHSSCRARAILKYFCICPLTAVLLKQINSSYDIMSGSGGFRGGALGASAPPAESIVEKS